MKRRTARRTSAKKPGRAANQPVLTEAERNKSGDELVRQLFLSRRPLSIVNEPEPDPALDRRMAAFANRQSLQDLQDDFDLEQAYMLDQQKLSRKEPARQRKPKK
jgi:hypothetical protein